MLHSRKTGGLVKTNVNTNFVSIKAPKVWRVVLAQRVFPLKCMCLFVWSHSNRMGWWCAADLRGRSHGHRQPPINRRCVHTHDVPARQGNGKKGQGCVAFLSPPLGGKCATLLRMHCQHLYTKSSADVWTCGLFLWEQTSPWKAFWLKLC